MELRHLRYFAAVAEELHFARAAARLNISAPTLSHQIGALETMLGAKLFSRKTKSTVALTNAGKRFLAEAHEALKQAAHAEQVGKRAGRGDAGSITVGYVLSAVCGGLVSTALAKYRKAHPHITYQLVRMQTVGQFKALIDGTLDISFARLPLRYPTGLTGFVIDRQKFFVALPEGHRLAARNTVAPAMLAGEEFVSTSLEMEIGFWSNISSISPPGAAIRIVDRAPDVFSVLAMVAAGAGVAVVSESLQRIAIPGVAFREIAAVTRTSDHVVAYRKNESAPVVKNFIRFLRSHHGAR